MENHNNEPESPEKSKQTPDNISGKDEGQAKERTKPLKEQEIKRNDQQEGNMNNGEPGGSFKKKLNL